MGNIISAIGGFFSSIVHAIANVITTIINGITRVILAIWDFITCHRCSGRRRRRGNNTAVV
ncbi:hypothetical protein KVV02_008392 [Mortierella alpina]|uniref:Uncharacterized protein n=1 Tax=Mortierella alpina TaxID=64518 RepID=A0A9P8CYW4_MORAP|nr:hypothetical protein KVV02_008392 [Mortierella alpina]